MRLYKIIVDHWPTDDGKPWPRFINAALPNEAQPWQTPVPDWALPLVYEDFSGMEEFARYTGDNSGWGPPEEIQGWVLPSPNAGPYRLRDWRSKKAAERWIAEAAK